MLERMVSTASSSGSTVCKVLVSARLSPTIAKKSRHKRTLSLSDEKLSVGKAIRQYARQRLQSMSEQLSQMGVTDADVGEIESIIVGKADGKFIP